MLESLDRLGLASSVITFVDLSGKLLHGESELYSSDQGALSSHAELECALRSFIALSTPLSVAPSQAPQASQASSRKPTLGEVAGECEVLANDFLAILEKLKPKDMSEIQKDSSASWQAFRGTLKDHEVQDYIRRLERLRFEFLACIASGLSNRPNTVLDALKHVSEIQRDIGVRNEPSLDSIRCEILKKIGKCQQTDDYQLILEDIRIELCKLKESAERMAQENQVLLNLQFQGINWRYDNVVDVDNGTYEWILSEASPQRPEVHLKEWLRSRNGIFWVSGKAGSGKSTLMKFLYDHPIAYQCLEEWAGENELVTSNFFFWLSGTEMQNSQEALFRSILFHILRKVPKLIPVICFERWQHGRSSDLWTREELLSAFDRLANEAESISTRFCLFIDGLDEYKGDHLEIIQAVRKLCTVSTIKICLSSRPWSVFSNAFGSDETNMLRLHELTHEDIRTYVQHEFQANIDLAKSPEGVNELDHFTNEIADRAQGVFFWVFLAVRFLLQGAQEGDNVEDFEKRLRELPTELEAYFKHMVKLYHPEAARILKICLSVPEPLSVMAISYFRHAKEVMVSIPASQLSLEELRQQIEATQEDITARCDGLFQFTRHGRYENAAQTFYPKVEFLHRTVKDCMQSEEVQQVLATRDPVSFVVDEYLTHAYLAQIRSLSHLDDSFNPLQSLVWKCFFHISQGRDQIRSNIYSSLEEIEAVMQPNFRRQFLSGYGMHLPETLSWTLGFAMQWPLHSSIKEKISHEPRENKSALLNAARDYSRFRVYTTPEMRIATVKFLLDAGASPNEALRKTTPRISSYTKTDTDSVSSVGEEHIEIAQKLAEPEADGHAKYNSMTEEANRFHELSLSNQSLGKTRHSRHLTPAERVSEPSSRAICCQLM